MVSFQVSCTVFFHQDFFKSGFSNVHAVFFRASLGFHLGFSVSLRFL